MLDTELRMTEWTVHRSFISLHAGLFQINIDNSRGFDHFLFIAVREILPLFAQRFIRSAEYLDKLSQPLYLRVLDCHLMQQVVDLLLKDLGVEGLLVRYGVERAGSQEAGAGCGLGFLAQDHFAHNLEQTDYFFQFSQACAAFFGALVFVFGLRSLFSQQVFDI